MASKRSATTELNHDNWDEGECPEEAGTFKKAADDVLEKRVVKRAKRRLQSGEDGTRSAFGTFTGFKTSPNTSNTSLFTFLTNSSTNANANDTSLKTQANISKAPTNSEAPKSNENGTNKKESSEIQTSLSASTNKKSAPDQEDQNKTKKSSEYFAKLKGLNESVAQWIKTHVDANPFCILTPIFKDYEKYLKDIESKHGNEMERGFHVTDQAQPTLTNDSKDAANTEKKLDTTSFGGINTKPTVSTTEWKTDKSIFGNINTGSKSIFGKSEHTVDSNKSIFSNTDQTSDAPKSVFGNIDQKPGTKNIFGSMNYEKNPFLSKSSLPDNKSDEQESKSDAKTTATSTFSATNTSTFCFGQSSTTTNTSTGFSFGSAKPFTFGAQAVKPQDTEENEEKEDEDDEPPKTDFKLVTEEGAIYQQRCKVFVKKDGSFSDRGIGTLFLKPTPNDKTQLLVRAETSLGNLLLNTLLTESIPTKRMNKNTIMLVCLPKPESTPPPVPVLLRVKTEEDADALFEALNKHKK
ncbi:nuclear pore complex protein Nup50 [Megachile rotundata]|uniref:nuclear pore complex protein Nup50 n=1 Tax=Megachile rotundata TaxID=143995 RepID=UPI003FD2B596